MLKIEELLQLHRVAILGGTFNPVHKGHICIAKSVLQTYVDLERLILMPNHIPAYKDRTGIVSDADRIAMLSLVAEDLEKTSVSDIEIKRGGYTYTVDTLEYLKKYNPNLELSFVIGDDSLYSFHKWHRYEDVLKLCHLLVAVRNEDHSTVWAYANRMKEQYPGARISVLPMEECKVSSTEIRQACKQGRKIDAWVCPKVSRYIREHKLYVEDSKD